MGRIAAAVDDDDNDKESRNIDDDDDNDDKESENVDNDKESGNILQVFPVSRRTVTRASSKSTCLTTPSTNSLAFIFLFTCIPGVNAAAASIRCVFLYLMSLS